LQQLRQNLPESMKWSGSLVFCGLECLSAGYASRQNGQIDKPG